MLSETPANHGKILLKRPRALEQPWWFDLLDFVFDVFGLHFNRKGELKAWLSRRGT